MNFATSRSLFFLLLGLVPSLWSYGQDDLHFEHLTTEQGLSNHYVMTIMQDRKGFLWFGTGTGMDKYDGYRFTNYKFDPRDTTSLAKNQVFTLYEDREGFIWVGTSEGTCRFNPRTEKFTRFERSTANPYAFKFAQSFSEDQQGNLWVSGSFKGELRQIDRITGRFSAINYANMLDIDTSVTQQLHLTFKDKSGQLWIGSPTGLHRLNLIPKGNGRPAIVSFTHYRHNPTDPYSLSQNHVIGIYEDHYGVLWALTAEGVLNALDRKSGRFTRYPLDPARKLAMYELLRTGIAEDGEGNLWVGTSRNGLYKVDKDRKIITPFVHDPADPGSIINNAIISVMVDKSGILWASTVDGVIKLNPNRKPFKLYRHNPADPHSLSQNNIGAIGEDSEGIVWIGTSRGGLNALNKTTGQFTHYRHDPQKATSLRSDAIGAIFEDQDGDLWVGNGENLSRFDRPKKAFRHYQLDHPLGLTNTEGPSIFTMYEDRQGLFWLGTNNGVLSFDRKTTKTTSYPYDPTHPERISDWWALSILEDRKGNLWIGPGSQALTRFDRKTGRFTQYKHDSRHPGSIGSNTVPSIYEDSKGTLWFGTGEGGLCRFNPITETFTTFTEQQGLAGNSVFSIVEDNIGNLWLGTNKGLSKFSLAKQTFTNYRADEGLQGNMFTTLYTEGAAFKGKDGTLYFGGSNGFNAFDPLKIRSNTYVPPIVITQVKLFDKLLPGHQEAKEISLDYDQNFISIEFAALNYTNSPNNQYAYQLVGVDKDWVYCGSRRVASYTDLGPGDYTFRVKGSNNDGLWNQQGASMRVIIHPPWWRTWWAYGFYGLCLLAGLFVLDRYQRRRLLERERERTKDRELAQAREIERAYHELQQTQAQLVQKEKMASLGELTAGIAHEIQNPLNFVNNFSEVSTELVGELREEHRKPDRDLAVEDELFDDLEQNLLKISHHGSRASAIVKGMLEHSRTATGERQPTDLNALCEEYLRLAYHGFRAKDKEFNAELNTSFDSNLGPVEVVPQEIGRVLLNLYNNAFYAVQQKQKTALNGFQPTVTVSTTQVNGHAQIRVGDNGIGIPDSVKAKIFQPFFTTKPTGEGTGLGLSLSYDIITKGHGGELSVVTKEGQYTEFVVSLPA